uniref:Uncharacterized protein n=1 Tax=Oryza sativa subsp. japonica TaxID=39947 RepID=Q84M72_ORYSJ|nr:hypothetical protein [Oryza sativa Japonica Group]
MERKRVLLAMGKESWEGEGTEEEGAGKEPWEGEGDGVRRG